MHVASNLHDPRFQNSRALPPIFVLPDIQNIGALVSPTTAVLYSPHMAPKKTTLKEIGEMLAHVVKHMATKDDLAAVETRLDRRIDKLDAKLDRLDTKLTKFEEHEIDKRKQLEVRVSAIEEHLGLDKKITA
jgi:dynactin complex subunit